MSQSSLQFFRTLAAVLLAACAATASAERTTRGPKQVVADPKHSAPLDFEVQYVYRSAGRGELKPLEDGAVLYSGDHYKIQFTPNERAYVYIFQSDSSGAVYPLFPQHAFGGPAGAGNPVAGNPVAGNPVAGNPVAGNPVAGNPVAGNPVQAGRVYSVPGPDASFQLDDQTGEESIYFLARRDPDPRLDAIAAQLNAAIRSGNAPQAELGGVRLADNIQTRGPKRIVADPGAKTVVKWNAEERSLLPVHRLNGLCRHCVSRVTFQHR